MGCFLELGPGIKWWVMGGVKEDMVFDIHMRYGQGSNKGCIYCSMTELGMTVEDGIWRREDNGEGLHLAYLFPWPAMCFPYLYDSRECLYLLHNRTMGWVWGRKCGGEDLVIHWGWGQRRGGENSRFSATDLGMRQGKLDMEEQKERCGSTFSLLVAWQEWLAGGLWSGLEWDQAMSKRREGRRTRSVRSTRGENKVGGVL